MTVSSYLDNMLLVWACTYYLTKQYVQLGSYPDEVGDRAVVGHEGPDTVHLKTRPNDNNVDCAAEPGHLDQDQDLNS